ncbi:putative wall-associated receptor kinase-like 16 [Miscanthus floridulus]|uniref:putative wall-associated receptor kinase-like 16 n=1 Tax=Miscanthus floridulus TaxID=154761 RepID=UPI003459D229
MVTEISTHDSTLRILRDDYINNTLPDAVNNTGGSYKVSARNEFTFYGCDMEATLVGVLDNTSRESVISRCATTCSESGQQAIYDADAKAGKLSKFCNGIGCCAAPIAGDSMPTRMHFTRIQVQQPINTSIQQPPPAVPISAYIAEEGWTEAGLPAVAAAVGSKICPGDVAGRLCKSEFSDCRRENPSGYTCHCKSGYDGNPYITGGCQDINECELPEVKGACFGECKNLAGSYECRCPRGTHGNHTLPNGCVKSITCLSIGIGIGSGASLIVLVAISIFMAHKLKHRRKVMLKRKFFKQNRGQLLQQLVSQQADIAERMIITVDELAKATNNFDKARELGGGGHGIVYKGILSDLHVVAIKKSKIAVQKEIDEFINEVAILSQINHRNVVKLLGCCLETEVPLLVYEFISNGTLYHHLHVDEPRSISWAIRLRIATEIAIALAYLHSSVLVPVIHRDIKSSNILLDDTLTSKVSDFGSSRYIPTDRTGLTTRVQGTIGYLDPMYFYTGRLTEKSDVYSYGVILVELLTRKKPFSYLSSKGDGLVAHFVSLLVEGNLAELLDPQVVEEGGEEVHEVAMLAASCIKLGGEDRPTMRQVEHVLEGLLATKTYGKDNMIVGTNEENCISMMKQTSEGQSTEETSRSYTMEREFVDSARYPR